MLASFGEKIARSEFSQCIRSDYIWLGHAARGLRRIKVRQEPNNWEQKVSIFSLWLNFAKSGLVLRKARERTDKNCWTYRSGKATRTSKKSWKKSVENMLAKKKFLLRDWLWQFVNLFNTFPGVWWNLIFLHKSSTFILIKRQHIF